MNIRTLTESDAAEWCRIRLESLSLDPCAFGKDVEEQRAIPVETIAARFRDAPVTALHLGAFEDGALVGIATFLRETAVKERHKGRIYGVYVSRAFRGRGIGRALLNRILEFAAQQATLEQILIAVGSQQHAAKSLYRSLGFETFGTEPAALKVGDTYVDEEHMILHLRRG